MKRYQGTFFLLLVSLLIQCVISLCPYAADSFAFHPNAWFGWFGLITYMVAHAGWGHLLGNFCFGLPFCLFLESRLGNKRFLEFYFLCGLGSAFLSTLMQGGGMIGSSGALFGVMAGACMEFGDTWQERLLAVGLFSVLFTEQLAAAPSGPLFGVAFYGHIGGCLTALLLPVRRNKQCLPKN